MNLGFKRIAVWLGAACLLASPIRLHAFALLGPYEPWMQESNGLRQSVVGLPYIQEDGVIEAEDIGGPMDIGSGYRWNVPIITYGFDKSFLDFFGTNGVVAVKNSIKVFNNLPPASSIVLTNFPVTTLQFSYPASALRGTNWLYDLKSQTLSLLLEQLGLSQPSRYVFVLKRWDLSLLPSNPNQYSTEDDWGGWAIPEFIVKRNFDPETLEPSSYVNEAQFSAFILEGYGYTNHFMVTFQGDPEAIPHPAVADFNQQLSYFYTGLTRDDVGGLRYLLSPKTISYETLLPDVQSVGREKRLPVNGAWRPGVDKITFFEQPLDPRTGRYRTFIYKFMDRYVNWAAWDHNKRPDVLMRQPVQRVVAKPDILFCVSDFGTETSPPQAICTGTTNWINNARRNGNPTGAGPGMIRPGITITFSKGGGRVIGGPFGLGPPMLWASFDGSTNAPIIYLPRSE
jgi:hypothetical protein